MNPLFRIVLGVCLLLAGGAGLAARSTVEVSGRQYPVYQLMTEVRPLRMVSPVYPKRAQDEGRGGHTVVGAVVDTKGRVLTTFVQQTDAAPDLQAAARKAVSGWRFPRQEEAGAPIPYVVFVPVTMQPKR